MKQLLAAMVLVVGYAGTGEAVTLNHCLVEWGASPSPDVATYTVYFADTAGAPGAAVGTVAAPALQYGSLTSCPVGGIKDGNQFVTVTAKDAAGNESVRSNEFPFVFDGTAPASVSNTRVR